MGFEIKNICTVVPNPHHPNYKTGDDFYYFSLFITPRLQFDGKLKEFYEMLHWHEYQDIFETDSNGKLSFFKLFVKDSSKPFIDIYCDETISNIQNQKLYFDEKLWRKLFHKDISVEAWPIYLKPQNIDTTLSDEKKDITSRDVSNDTTKISEYNNLYNRELLMLSYLSGDLSKSEVPEPKDERNNQNIENEKKESKERSKQNQFESLKYRQEFHQKISALSQYPHLLRMLGLIHDFKTPIDKSFTEFKRDNVCLLLKLNVDLNKYQNESEGDTLKAKRKEFVKSVKFVCPFTKSVINTDNKLVAYDKVEKNGEIIKDYSDIVNNGFLRRCAMGTNEPVFQVDQNYLENQTEKFATKTEIKPDDPIGFDGNTLDDEDIKILKQKVEKVNTYSKGFAIKVFAQAAELLTTMDEAFNNLNDDNIEDDESAFLAHHLDCGYRVDVKAIPPMGESEDFRSLCLREATYTIDKDPIINFNREIGDSHLFGKPKRNKLFDHSILDEPWLEEVRQINNEGESGRFEEIARWNGWSLTCPPMHATNQPNPEYDDLELEDIRPISLPKLRFGWSYQFRIRTVDICGNGPCLSLDENAMEESTFTVIYDRKEPVAPPLFFPPNEILLYKTEGTDKKVNKYINPRYNGEDNETLVIRSKVGENGKIEKLFNDSCIRFLTPAQISPHFAEVSGLLDPYWFPEDSRDKQNLYDFLSAGVKSFYSESDIKDGIPFPFDPIVSGVKIFKSNQLEDEESNPIFCFRQNEEGRLLETTKPLKLILSKKDGSSFINSIKISLKEGESKTKWIVSCGVNVQNFISKEFRLIHAVQKPYFESDIDNSKISKNFKFGKNTQYPDEQTKDSQKYEAVLEPSEESVDLPFQTTGEIILTAQYNEYVLNPENEKGWSYISKDFPIEKRGELLKGINEDKKAQADKFYIQKSWSNLKPTEDNNILETQLVDSVKLKDIIESDIFYGFKHTFPDTKFREVTYKIELVSKFQSFFDIEYHRLNGEKPFSREIRLGCHKIQNSSKPSKPNITSIVPIFKTKTDDKTCYTFEHSSFRIYLGKSWYETGLEEKIAVIHDEFVNSVKFREDDGLPLKDGSKTEIDSIYFKNKVSIFAEDPTISKNDSYDSTYMDPEKLHKSYKQDGYDSLHVNINLFESTIEIPSQSLGNHTKQVFSVFDVKWCKEKQEFFCDILLNKKAFKSYSYLVKFALCRYQENSIKLEEKYDYRFSDAVMTDMVSIQAERKVLFGNGKVTVSGIKGSRNTKKENFEDVFPEDNIIYLISEYLDTIGEKNLSDVQNVKKFNAQPIPIGKEYSVKDIRSYNSFTIEEYEHIKLNDKFKSIDNPVNPRNDPSKRLVFFYKLPKI